MVTFQSLCSKTRASHPRQSKNWRKWCPVWTKIFLHFSWESSPFNAMTSKWTFASNGRWSISLICYLYAQKAGNKRPCFVFWLSNMCTIHSWFSFVGRAVQYLCPPSSPSPSETKHFQPILRRSFGTCCCFTQSVNASTEKNMPAVVHLLLPGFYNIVTSVYAQYLILLYTSNIIITNKNFS